MSDQIPAWAHERAEVRPHDPQWAVRAAAERAVLAPILAPCLVEGIEHVGSTSVPGLAAKPIVDLAVTVRDLDLAAAEVGPDLAAAGWHFVPPDLDGRPWRRFFVKPDATGRHREAHLHLIAAGHPRWSEQIRFRDALRCDGALARRYGDLKRLLAEQHGDDREAYTAGKAAFIEEAVAATRE
ncbi:GrpB family protein [Glycomyces terrestris]|uniref:GrpB family protein n=1 Tax=Glycomyces terrestris TaxID=2493553 RepID=A0A426UY91_9ACTN|nr:GrpB family protein [Glycomyces terrestris]RRR99531.1 GrpB family protein [Glycomyces terrestris]